LKEEFEPEGLVIVNLECVHSLLEKALDVLRKPEVGLLARGLVVFQDEG